MFYKTIFSILANFVHTSWPFYNTSESNMYPNFRFCCGPVGFQLRKMWNETGGCGSKRRKYGNFIQKINFRKIWKKLRKYFFFSFIILFRLMIFKQRRKSQRDFSRISNLFCICWNGSLKQIMRMPTSSYGCAKIWEVSVQQISKTKCCAANLGWFLAWFKP